MATYGFLVNKLIRKVNEVETTAATFNTAIGVTATAKDAIIDALDTIYNRKFKWPFMAVVQNVTIPLGATTMPFEADMLSVDWNSFVLLPDVGISYRGSWLQVLNTDEYYRYHMISDMEKLNNDPTNSSGNSPRYVVYTEVGGNKSYTLSPPNQMGTALTLSYKYFRKPVRPENFDDVVDIPDEWQYVLMARALWYMYVFYDNNDRADRVDVEFKDAFKDMVTQLLTNQNHHVYSGQVEQMGPNAYGSKYLG